MEINPAKYFMESLASATIYIKITSVMSLKKIVEL